MELNYMQKSNGLYLLKKENIEDIATSVLKDYSPQNLEYPIALNDDDFLQEYLGLSIKQKYIGTFESGILGAIVMTDELEIPSYDEMFRPTILLETFGNVLISPILAGRENTPRRRYTKIHEASHSLLHQPYYDLKANTNNNASLVACRKIETYNSKKKTDEDWKEWQADYLAAALLMPKDIFYSYVHSLLFQRGVHKGYLVEGQYQDKLTFMSIIDDISKKFKVSHRAAQIRMLHLGLIRKPYYN